MSEEATLRDVADSFCETHREIIISTFGVFLDGTVSKCFTKDGKPKFRTDCFDDNTGSRQIVETFIWECGEWRKEGRKRRKICGRHQEYQRIGDPSSFGKPSGWSKWQEKETEFPIMCLRPAANAWINIQIMHPVFGEIVEILDSGEPTTRDYVMAAEFCAVMPDAYVTENSRRDTINDIFNRYISSSGAFSISVQCIANKFDTDGTCKAAGTNVDYKNEKGKGESDPYMQNIGYYIQYWGSENNHGPNLHCCPWMLIEVIGQEIGISGAVYACGTPCSQPLSNNVPFLPVPADKRTRIQQARVCSAIRHGFNALKTFYESVSVASVNSQAGFPYERNFTKDGENATLTYIKPLFETVHRMLFIAKVDNENEQHVVVKFTDRYNENAHRLAAENNFAPELYCVQELSCGLKMIVMEYIEEFRCWGHDGKEDEAMEKQLEQFLEFFSGKGLVHGDLRPPNLLVVGGKLCVVDFDWAGSHGETDYPVVVNQSEPWARGVQAGQTMLKEHDVHMVRGLLNKQQSR